MALTLAQSANLSNDVVLAGIYDTVIKESGGILDRLPFIDLNGNALAYNREVVVGGADFYNVGDTWAEETPGITNVTTSLKILGGDADVDHFLQQTRSNVQDLAAAVLELRVKALTYKFLDQLVYGDSSSNAKSFDGLHKLVAATAGQNVHIGSGSTGAALSLKKLDELVDSVRPGKPDFLMCSRRTRRGISAYARALTSPVQYSVDGFGQRVMTWDGIPILTNDFMLDTEVLSSAAYSAATGGATSSIFAVKVGEGLLAGVQNGGIQKELVGTLESKDADRWRVKWYLGLALFSILALGCLDGVTSADVTA